MLDIAGVRPGSSLESLVRVVTSLSAASRATVLRWGQTRCKMRAVGSTPVDVLRELQHRFMTIEPVAACMLYDARSNRIAVTTLLEDFDADVEARIAEIELWVCTTYEEFSFDFDTVHLRGRDPAQFVRPGAASLLVDCATRARQAIG